MPNQEGKRDNHEIEDHWGWGKNPDKCPDCGADLKCGHGGGVECTVCDYWFCF